MIQPVILTGILDRQQVLDLLDDADGRRIARRIGANLAEIVVRQIVAPGAIAYVSPEPGNRFGHQLHVAGLHAQQMHSQPHRRASADTRQAGQLRYDLVQKFRHIG